MAASKIGLHVWLGSITVLWSLQPLLLSHARGVLVLGMVTAMLALLGWLTGWSLLVVWSGGLGLCNLTLALVLTSHPPDLWVGLSAGITLLALLDGSHRLAYLRHCRLTPGVMAALLGTFVRLSGLTLVAGLVLGLLLVPLGQQSAGTTLAGLLTIAGACLFVGSLAAFLLYTSRWPNDHVLGAVNTSRVPNRPEADAMQRCPPPNWRGNGGAQHYHPGEARFKSRDAAEKRRG
jgi:hypothetical protein